ncbi:hypothetical protein C8J57DRAFT_1512129 [Mycena rebaudengoi]|nr:hypothetical protein C8J57DRAFT_1512129 [Mycena rebaudengoi]
MKRGPAAMVGVWHKWHSTGSRAASSSPFSPSSSSSLLSLFSYFSLAPFPPPIPGSSVLPTVPPLVSAALAHSSFLLHIHSLFLLHTSLTSISWSGDSSSSYLRSYYDSYCCALSTHLRYWVSTAPSRGRYGMGTHRTAPVYVSHPSQATSTLKALGIVSSLASSGDRARAVRVVAMRGKMASAMLARESALVTRNVLVPLGFRLTGEHPRGRLGSWAWCFMSTVPVFHVSSLGTVDRVTWLAVLRSWYIQLCDEQLDARHYENPRAFELARLRAPARSGRRCST